MVEIESAREPTKSTEQSLNKPLNPNVSNLSKMEFIEESSIKKPEFTQQIDIPQYDFSDLNKKSLECSSDIETFKTFLASNKFEPNMDYEKTISVYEQAANVIMENLSNVQGQYKKTYLDHINLIKSSNHRSKENMVQ